MKSHPLLLWGLLLTTSAPVAEVFASTGTSEQPNFSGGTTTYRGKLNTKAFQHPASNLSFEQRMPFNLGNSLFKKLWVSSPSSTTASDGLGPLYNARSCRRCHIRNGRGHPPEPDDTSTTSLMLRLSIANKTEDPAHRQALKTLGVVPEPTYGTQLQDRSVPGLPAEGTVVLHYTTERVKLADGTEVKLRQPHYRITDPAYGPLQPGTLLSARIAPPMIGLGLLEAISAEDILAQEDPDDQNADGISGRANRVWDSVKQASVLGRFGWKAGQPNLMQQNNSAFANDIGISSPMFPQGAGECTAHQPACLSLPDGNSPHLDNAEISAESTQMLAFYTQHLAVPARRNLASVQVQAGEQLFHQIGCAACHTPHHTTSKNAPPALAGQSIWPYSDMLLHDMGEGLADKRPEFLANGREWRTPPLWGIGLTKLVSGHTQFLHDGRARNLEEAILWHGGEARASNTAYQQLARTQRAQLLQFLESL